MSYQSLYRKYRPKSFDQVVGQEAIVNALTNALAMHQISHAYLFTGPRGTGKTTIAKLFAGAVNCEGCSEEQKCNNCIQNLNGQHPDIIEIDAASNNGVDEIRLLIEKVKYMPIMGRYKVYIVDEVHMLSQSAFNALLKTLEEPPEHVIFILATTEVHKVLPTIISRCQRYDFKHISNLDIAQQLDLIIEKEGRKAMPGVSQLIASLAGGGMRNALTILEQALIISDGTIEVEALYDNFGLIFPSEKIELFEAIRTGDIALSLGKLAQMTEKSVDIPRFLMGIVTGLKDSLVYSYTQSEQFMDINERDFILYLAKRFDTNVRLKMTDNLLERYDKLKQSQNQQTHLELAILSLFEGAKEQATQAVVETKEAEVSQPEPIVIEETKESEPILEETPTLDFDEPVVEEAVVPEIPRLDLDEAMPSEKQETKNNLDLSSDEIVQLMVTADKELRMVDEPSFRKVKQYFSDMKWARVSRLLDNTKLALSGQRFILVVTHRQIQSREIMEERNLYELMDFVELLVGTKKQVFATTETDFTKAIEAFKIATSQNRLPDPLEDEEFMSYTVSEEIEERDEALEAVRNLFGDSVRIV